MGVDSKRIDDVDRKLRDRIEEFVEFLVGPPNRHLSSNNQNRYGKKGGLAVDIAGDTRGRITPFDGDRRGRTPLQFIQYHFRLGSFWEAVEMAEHWLGNEPENFPQDKSRLDGILTNCQPINGTPAETYLNGRGIRSAPENSVHFHPNSENGFGAVVFRGTNDHGETTSIQRVFITPDGHKALIEGLPNSKRTNGRGGILRLAGNEERLTLCEGPETGLSVWQATGNETWVAFGSILKLAEEVPADRHVIIARDGDEPDSAADRAVHKAISELRERGCMVEVACPSVGQDWNDILRADGDDAVRTGIEAAATPHMHVTGIVNPSLLNANDIPKRKWLVEGYIPAGRVTLLTGDGGVGKSLLAQQLCVSAAVGCDWVGIPTTQSRTFGLFCEDEDDELFRRQIDICNGLGVRTSEVREMRWLSGLGQDNVLMNFDPHGTGATPTDRFIEILDFLIDFAPGLVVIDTAADTFGGNEIIRNQVRTFMNGCLGRICRDTGAAVVLLSHPSQYGKSSGSGYSGSTAWHNNSRARLYLDRAVERDDEPTRRILRTMKQNYAANDGEIELNWHNGMFKPVTQFGGMLAALEKREHENAFLNCLDALHSRNSRVCESPHSGNFAPKVMASMPERGKSNRRDLERAMQKLFSNREITNRVYGYPSKNMTEIVRSTGDASATSKATTAESMRDEITN